MVSVRPRTSAGLAGHRPTGAARPAPPPASSRGGDVEEGQHGASFYHTASGPPGSCGTPEASQNATRPGRRDRGTQAAKVAKRDREILSLKGRTPERDALTRYQAALRRQKGYLDRVVTAARESDDAAFGALVAAKKANDRKRLAAAIDLGLNKCGKP